MKKLIVIFAALLLFAACVKDGPKHPLPEISIENLSDATSVGQKDTIRLRAVVGEGSENTIVWSVDGTEAGGDEVFRFVSSVTGNHSVTLSCTNDAGTATETVVLEVYPQFRHGTFVLNEGSAFSENGSLVFISPQGVVEENAYRAVNGSELGNACQDMFITRGGKMYVVAQNSGKLTVADSETLEYAASYDDELSGLSWPSNIAVLDDRNVFIRDNNGIHVFDTETRTVTFVEGSAGASKNRMAVAGGKVFAPCGTKVAVLKAGQAAVDGTIEIGGTVRGVIKSADGNVWVATKDKIAKINAADYSVIKEESIQEGSIGDSWGFFASPGITAIGEAIYYSGGSKKIYRHDFAAGTGKLMVNVPDFVENAGIQYNDIAVNPRTGEVYINTIKGYGTDYLINSISVFDLGGEEPKLTANYKDYTRFPAGIYFTYDFE